MSHPPHLFSLRSDYHAPANHVNHGHLITAISSESRRLTPKPLRARVLFCIENYRLRDWLTGFIPYGIRWLRAPCSKGKRKKQIRVPHN